MLNLTDVKKYLKIKIKGRRLHIDNYIKVVRSKLSWNQHKQVERNINSNCNYVNRKYFDFLILHFRENVKTNSTGSKAMDQQGGIKLNPATSMQHPIQYFWKKTTIGDFLKKHLFLSDPEFFNTAF